MDKPDWAKYEEDISGPALARYNFAEKWLRFHGYDKSVKVIDAACSYGYGASILSNASSHVLGVDPDNDAVQYGLKYWRRPGVELECGEIFEINRLADVVVSFDTLISTQDQAGLLEKFSKTAPWLILSSPNHKTDTADLIRDAGYDIRERWSQDNEQGSILYPGLNGQTYIYVAKSCHN